MPDDAMEPPVAEPRPPPATAGTPPTAPPPAPVEEDWSTRYKYLLADFENYRRRTERDRESISRQARAGLVRELLPLFEAFRAAREAVGSLPPDSPVRRGLELLDREWATFLRHEGVEPVAQPGLPFSSIEHEAVGEAPETADHPAGTIVEVVQQGYRFFGGLLRPAKVIVARAPPPTTEGATP
ncbi:MAG TPA: nucleotide exchange factor GrpE [Thermoplasmata archaeon]|nr:nucleotide exchange factor GrpE [Thermoplasmata archaeon]